MHGMLYPQKRKLLRKSLCGFVAFAFSLSLIVLPVNSASAQYISNLPAPGAMVLPSAAFEAPVLKGMTLDQNNPLHFNFFVDIGQDRLSGEPLKKETEKLIKFYLAALTTPDDESWVNLSPYENDHIIPDPLAATEMGKVMLEQDYLLKQLSASLTSPETELGKKFWNTVYQKAFKEFGTTQVPISTFNKVWIVPDKAELLEDERGVYVGSTRLKVMMDQDYLSIKENLNNKKIGTDQVAPDKVEQLSALSAQVVKEIIIPELEKEVNEGKNFAPTRQIYHSVILAVWFKDALKESLLGKVYVDKKKMGGVTTKEADVKEKVYNQYLEAFRKGVYNLIKEDYDLSAKETLPRKYFSGGMTWRSVKESLQPLNLDRGQMAVVANEFRNWQKSVGANPGEADFTRFEAQILNNRDLRARGVPTDKIQQIVSLFKQYRIRRASVNFTEGRERAVVESAAARAATAQAGSSQVIDEVLREVGVPMAQKLQGEKERASFQGFLKDFYYLKNLDADTVQTLIDKTTDIASDLDAMFARLKDENLEQAGNYFRTALVRVAEFVDYPERMQSYLASSSAAGPVASSGVDKPQVASAGALTVEEAAELTKTVLLDPNIGRLLLLKDIDPNAHKTQQIVTEILWELSLINDEDALYGNPELRSATPQRAIRKIDLVPTSGATIDPSTISTMISSPGSLEILVDLVYDRNNDVKHRPRLSDLVLKERRIRFYQEGQGSAVPFDVSARIANDRLLIRRITDAAIAGNMDSADRNLDKLRVALPGSPNSSPYLVTIGGTSIPRLIDVAKLSVEQIIDLLDKYVDNVTPEEAQHIKDRKPFNFSSVEKAERNLRVYQAALKSGLLGVQYIATNIQRFSDNSHIAYIDLMQRISREYNGYVVTLLGIGEKLGGNKPLEVFTGDGSGMATLMQAIRQVYGDEFLKTNNVDLITDGGQKERGGNLTGLYGYNGAMPTPYGITYYERAMETLFKVRAQYKDFGRDGRHIWTASDGDYEIGNLTAGPVLESQIENHGNWSMIIHGEETEVFPEKDKSYVFARIEALDAIRGRKSGDIDNSDEYDRELRADPIIAGILGQIVHGKLDQLGENFSDPNTGRLVKFIEKPKPAVILQMLKDNKSNRIIPNSFLVVYNHESFMELLDAYNEVTSDGKRLSEYSGSYFQGLVESQFNPKILNEKFPGVIQGNLRFIAANILPKEKIVAAGLGTIGRFTDRGKTDLLTGAFKEALLRAKKEGKKGIISRDMEAVETHPNVKINLSPDAVVILENVRIIADRPVTLNITGNVFIQNSVINLTEDITTLHGNTVIVDSSLHGPIDAKGAETNVFGVNFNPEEHDIYDLNPEGQWVPVRQLELYGGETMVGIQDRGGDRYLNRTITEAPYKDAKLNGIIGGDFEGQRMRHPRSIGIKGLTDPSNGDKQLIQLANWRGPNGPVPIGLAKEYMDYYAKMRDMAGLAKRSASSSVNRVLLVEDNEDIRFLTASALKREGYEVLEAGDTQEAKRVMAGQPMDLILLDNNMPGQSGLEWIRELSGEQNTVPVIMLSDDAAARDKTVALSRQAGFEFVKAAMNKATTTEEIVRLQGQIEGIASVPVIGEQETASAPGDPSAVGGIDFDPRMLNLQIRRDGKGVPLPLPQQNLEQINIDGLYPVILNIQPATLQNFPFLMSSQSEEKIPELSMR